MGVTESWCTEIWFHLFVFAVLGEEEEETRGGGCGSGGGGR
jgi:hypothetical protein